MAKLGSPNQAHMIEEAKNTEILRTLLKSTKDSSGIYQVLHVSPNYCMKQLHIIQSRRPQWVQHDHEIHLSFEKS